MCLICKIVLQEVCQLYYFCVLFVKMNGMYPIFDGLNVKFVVLCIVFLNLSTGLPK